MPASDEGHVPSRGLTSTVIPCFNAAPTIAEAIESALAQGVEGDRLIVVDDGSTDGSADVAARYQPHLRIQTVANGGASRARNIGLAATTTPYVLFLDADDVYLENAVAEFERVASETQADLVLGTTQEARVGDRSQEARRFPPDTTSVDTFAAAWLSGHSVQTNSHYWRAAYLRQIGGWNEEMRILEEIEIVARAALAGATIAVSPASVSLYRHFDRPERVSFGSTEAVVASAIDGFLRLEPATVGKPQIRRALGRRFYDQARAAFRLGFPALGRKALALARELGFAGHVGTRSHRLLSALVGLERKEALRRVLR